MKVVVIVPTYNEHGNIVGLIEALCLQFASLRHDMNILVVDDHSPDGTAEAVRELLPRHPELRLIEGRKAGLGAAYIRGMTYAIEAMAAEVVFEMDADFSHRPEDLTPLMVLLEEVDVAIGSRYLPGSQIENWGWKRTLFSSFANRVARTLLRIPITDYTNGLRAYRRWTVEELEMETIDARGYVVLSEVAYQLHRTGARISEVTTIYLNRQRGETKACGSIR